jgi:predicted nucleic acid-binding Zn ribbon protein
MDESSKFPTRLRDLLNPISKRFGLDASVEAGRVFAAWSDIVGSDVARHVRPRVLKDGVLQVRTDSAAWAGELKYLAPQIIQQINTFVGRAVVSELRITTGPLSEPSREGPKATPTVGSRGIARVSDDVSDRALEEPLSALQRAREAQRRRRAKRRSDLGF